MRVTRIVACIATLTVLTGTLLMGVAPGASAAAVYRPFTRSSFWNAPLPRNAPRDTDSRAMIRWLLQNNSSNYIRLGGAGSTGEWGLPIYWPRRHAHAYDVRNNCSLRQPEEFNRMRIPRGAGSDPTGDAAMVVYDRAKGLVYGLWHAHKSTNGSWSSCGGTVFYLHSNGLDGSLRASNERRNRGHRGVPPSAWGVRHAEIKAGEIRHVLKISVNTTRCRHIFPMVADTCGTGGTYAPPEGTRIRIKPSVDLSQLHLSRAARIVATALQRYGAVIADQSGGPVTMKLENTVAERRGWLWRGVLDAKSLEKIPLGSFEVIAAGYRP